MSKELVSSIDIAAPAERVWEVLVDFAAFPAWNPFITHAEGRLEVGGRLTLRMQPVGGSAVTLRPTVVEVVDGQRLRWQGRLGLPRLFDADHLFTVEPGAAGSRVVHSKSSSTVCSCRSFIGRWTRGTLPAFHAMNAALKVRRESCPTALTKTKADSCPSAGEPRSRRSSDEGDKGRQREVEPRSD